MGFWTTPSNERTVRATRIHLVGAGLSLVIALLLGLPSPARAGQTTAIPCPAKAKAVFANIGQSIHNGNSTVTGDVQAAQTIVHNGGVITGTQLQNTPPGFAVVPVPAGATNLGSVTINGTRNFTAGNYVASTFQMNGGSSVTVSGGIVQIWVTGNLVLLGQVNAGGNPQNLEFLVTGSQGAHVNSNTNFSGFIYAPAAPVLIDSVVHGSIVGSQTTLNSGGQVMFDPGSSCMPVIDPATVIAAQSAFAVAAGDPKVADLFTAVLSSFSSALTPYQVALLNLALYINANADLLADPSTLNSSQLARLPAFQATVRGSQVDLAITTAGQNLLKDPASLSAAINSFATAAGQPASLIPPAPAESCGGVQPSLRTALNNFRTAPAVSSLLTQVPGIVHAPGFAASLNAVGAANLLSLSTLSNLALPASGAAQPIFSLLNTIKGAVEVAAAVTAVAVLVVATPESELAIGLTIAGAALAAGAGGIDLYEGITENDSSCPGTSPQCSANSQCGGNVCSYGCCVTSQTAGALVATGVVDCALQTNCAVGNFCGSEGCCHQIIIP